jgi:hypothetical protein
VISKGTRQRELVPISPDPCVRLAHYLDSTVSASVEPWFWVTFRARATEGHRNRDHERPSSWGGGCV